MELYDLLGALSDALAAILSSRTPQPRPNVSYQLWSQILLVANYRFIYEEDKEEEEMSASKMLSTVSGVVE